MEDEKKTKKQLIEELNSLRLEQIEQTRVTSEKFTKAFLQNSIPVTITTVKDGRFIDVSDAFLQLVGLKRDEVIGHTSREAGFITEEQRTLFYNELSKNGRVENLEMEVSPKGKGLRYGLFNVVMMNINNENYLLTTIQDITERKRTEEELRNSRQQLNHIANNIPVFVNYVNAQDLRYKFVNKYFAHLFGKLPEEIVGRQVKDILPADVYQRAMPYIDRARSGERIRYENMVPIQGEPHWFSIDYMPETDEQGSVNTIIILGFDITERKLAEEALQLSNERLIEAQKIAMIGDWEANLLTDELHWSQAIFDIFALDAKSFKPSVTAFYNAVHPDDRGLVIESEERSEQTGLHDVVHRIIRPSGEIRFVRELARRYKDDQGKLIMLRGTVHDITDLKQTDEALRKSEERFRLITENMVDCVALVDTSGTYQYVTPSYRETLGYEQNDMIGITGYSLTHPDDMERVLKLYMEGIEKGWRETNYETRLRHKDGHYVSMEIRTHALNDPQGIITGGVISARDITERRQFTDALQESEKRYRLIADNTADLISILDMNMNFTYVSPATMPLRGFTVEEAMGQTLEQVLTPESMRLGIAIFEEELQREASGTADPDRTRILELEEYKKDGSIIWVEVSLSFLRDKDNKPFEILIVSRDITTRKQVEAEKAALEAQNRQLQKSESLGRMAGAIAHHFNNQLGAVIGNLEMAMDELPKNAGTHQTLTKAMQSAWKAADMSGLMLTYLGQTHDKRESLDLSYSCRKILPLIKTTLPANVVMETDFPSPRPIIMANAGEIQQILTNLITNAWEAIGNSTGSISLSVKTVSPAEISTAHLRPVRWQPQNNAYACLEVTDTGCGIAASDIEQLFDPFFTDKFTGRGMGLPVVLGIVKTHKGAITVESKLGKGSTFRIFFPLSEEALLQPQTAEINRDITISSPSPRKMEEGGTVLVVEDEEMLRDMAAAMLESFGFTVLKSKDGIDALDVFGLHQSEIKFVLTDLTMPRMNGWETLTELRKLQPNILVILASGYDLAHVMEGVHPELPQAFLAKPYNLTALRAAISQVLESRKN